ncbi:helix-turn-helix domain-containing protein [Candidatus Woesearchaeota archaeon]|nr:helix-turn-helix domain-containing protein [Candidatus Woesearchaeota archaeon]
MWIAKIKYKHDCILGNRCKKFKVTLQSLVFSVFKDKGKVISSSLSYMAGKEKNLNAFINDLKKDKNVSKLERKGRIFFLLEKAEIKAVKFYTPKLIFIKPVLMDEEGYETWETGSWKKEEVARFVNGVKKDIKQFKLLKFHQVKLDEIFFPRLMPNLTEKQKEAMELAINEGYYKRQKSIDLRKLAKLMKVSLATYHQHLRAAEGKLIPSLLSYSK